jgi:uncharacterized protein YgiM (DUF1202 family)
MLPLLSAAEFVVPIGTVEEFVNIRMIPDTKSEVVGRLFQGDSATLVQSTDEWHEVEIAGGATGYISSEWTLVLDELPAPVVEEAPQELAADVKVSTATTETAAVIPESNMSQDMRESKENIAELTSEEALAALANLEPVTFSYTQEDQERHVGFGAENVPDLVASSESEGLKPLEIVAVLTRVVKLQQHQIEELEARLEERE